MADVKDLHYIIAEVAALIEEKKDISADIYDFFLLNSDLAGSIIDLMQGLDENLEYFPVYSACIVGLEICIHQLHTLSDIDKKNKPKQDQLMDHLSRMLHSNQHDLSFWMPVLNVFYDAQIELTTALKDAYFELAQLENEPNLSQEEYLNSMEMLIKELSELSDFEIADHFFAQSHAMPPEFFSGLIKDLCSIPHGVDVALLVLLHPNLQVRQVALATLNELMPELDLSSTALTRLNIIQDWYAPEIQSMMRSWIKIQRKKGVVFKPKSDVPTLVQIRATEIDGTQAQGIFIQAKKNKKNRLCGLLLKSSVGIKDVWITPFISSAGVSKYYHEAFSENMTLRFVDEHYFQMIVGHFLALTVAKNAIPGMQFLEVLEYTGLSVKSELLNLDYCEQELSMQITPFTQDMLLESLKRSKKWLKTKSFTESWFLEGAPIDKIVNQNSSFVDGVKVCDLEQAMADVFSKEIEPQRTLWQFHFLWVALWAKSKAKANEKIWQDAFFIAHCIKEGMALSDIPVMQEIGYQTVVNSIETMHERKTYLT